jgi:hypothetical protein
VQLTERAVVLQGLGDLSAGEVAEVGHDGLFGELKGVGTDFNSKCVELGFET